MDKIIHSYQSLINAVNKLAKNYIKQRTGSKNIYKLEQSMDESLILHFKFTIDLFWKYLKKYFEANKVLRNSQKLS